jgi:AraC-like DNA-binding protein
MITATSIRPQGVGADSPGRLAPPHMIASSLADLIAGARRSLDNDLRLAHYYLEQIAVLIENPERSTLMRALLPVVLQTPRDRVAKGGLTHWQSARVRRHIDTRLSSSIRLRDMAEVAMLSQGHFCRAFKVSFGETPHAFVIRQRIRLAQTLMLGSRDTLSQIAYACGLTDQAHLTRLFRRLVDDTPLNWRRTWQGVGDALVL